MAYGDFKDLNRRISAENVLRDQVFYIAKNPKHDRYERGIASMVYNFFDKITSGGTVQNENISIKELAEELDKLIIRKLSKRKLQSPGVQIYQICNW